MRELLFAARDMSITDAHSVPSGIKFAFFAGEILGAMGIAKKLRKLQRHFKCTEPPLPPWSPQYHIYAGTGGRGGYPEHCF